MKILIFCFLQLILILVASRVFDWSLMIRVLCFDKIMMIFWSFRLYTNMTIGIGFCFLIKQTFFSLVLKQKKSRSEICMVLLFGLWAMMLGQDEY
jgi:hypothetical protein